MAKKVKEVKVEAAVKEPEQEQEIIKTCHTCSHRGCPACRNMSAWTKRVRRFL